MKSSHVAIGPALFALLCGPAHSQVVTNVPPPVAGAKPATVEHLKVQASSLEGNLEGNAVDRDVIVILPPSYAASRRQYPVVYALSRGLAGHPMGGYGTTRIGMKYPEVFGSR